MSINTFIPTIWEAQINKKLYDDVDLTVLATKKYSGTIVAGGSVQINTLSEPTVTDYDKSSALSYEEWKGSGQILNIDHKKNFATKLDDIDKIQASKMDFEEATTLAARALKRSATTEFVKLYADAGSTITVSSLDSGNIISTVLEITQTLKEKNLDLKTNEVFLALPPWVVTKLKLAKIVYDTNNTMILAMGAVGRVDGVILYESNSITTTGTKPNYTSECMAGSFNAIAFVGQLMKVEALRDKDSWSDLLRGLFVFGLKVIAPEQLVRVTLTYNAETTI